MKKFAKIFCIILLIASMFTMMSCEDLFGGNKPDPNPPPASTYDYDIYVYFNGEYGGGVYNHLVVYREVYSEGVLLNSKTFTDYTSPYHWYWDSCPYSSITILFYIEVYSASGYVKVAYEEVNLNSNNLSNSYHIL